MTTRSAFELFAAARGGVCPIKELASIPHLDMFATREREHVLILEQFEESCAAAGQRRTMQLGYTHDMTFDAAVTSRGAVDVIAINAGVPLRLANVIHAFVTTMFDADEADAHQEPIMSEEAALSGQVHLHSLPTLPPKAKLIFEALLSYAEHFVFQHEFAHVVNGHLDWINQVAGRGDLAELGMASRQGLSGIDMHTLEWDADCEATWRILTHAASIEAGSEMPEVRLAIMAIYIVAKMFGSETHLLNEGEILNRDHPPAYVRITNIFAYASSVLEQTEDTEEEAMMRIISIVSGSSKVWARTFGVDPVNYGDGELIKVGASLIKRITGNWIKLRPQLDELKRYGTLRQLDT